MKQPWFGTMIPLRLFIGLMMPALAGLPGASKPWVVCMVLGGFWLVIPAVAEAYLRVFGSVTDKDAPVFVRKLSASRVWGYFITGAVWFGSMVETVDLPVYVAPIVLLFLFWVAVNDAFEKRHKVTGNVKNRVHTMLY